MATNDKWLDQVSEETLEPDLPICDPHHHLWDFRHGTVEPTYLLPEILADVNSGHNIVSTVFIECGTMFNAEGPEHMKPVNETEFVNGIAAMSASGMYGKTRIAAGIIGTAYLSEGDRVAEVLDAQIEAGRGRFRGIRQAAAWCTDPDIRNHRTDPIPGLYLDATFQQGFKHLAPREMTYEGWCFHPQIPELAELAKKFPDTTIILDHFGGPLGMASYADKKDEVFEVWKKSITEISQYPNVYAKLGGIAMDVNGYGWEDRPLPPTSAELMEASRHYYEYTMEKFGIERCMFESNFPVDKMSCSYHVLWNSFKRLTAGYSEAEKASLYHDTAARVYRV